MPWNFFRMRQTSMTCYRHRVVVLLLLLCASAAAEQVPVLLQRAVLAESQHRFDEAQRTLHAVLGRNPRDPSAWLRLASIATVRGDIDAARTACSNAAAHVDPVVSLACRGRIALATLEYDPAYAALKSVLDHPHYRDREDESTRWACGVAAELAVALRQHTAADHLFQRALNEASPVQLWAARLDQLLATARATRVLELVPPREVSTVLQLRRLIALRELGRENEARQLIDYFDWEFRQALQLNDYTHGREIARFYLDVVPRQRLALLAASHNIDNQREAEDFALYQRALAAIPIW